VIFQGLCIFLRQLSSRYAPGIMSVLGNVLSQDRLAAPNHDQHIST